MGQGDVKNPQTDKRVGNKSGNMGRNQGSGQKSQGQGQNNKNK